MGLAFFFVIGAIRKRLHASHHDAERIPLGLTRPPDLCPGSISLKNKQLQVSWDDDPVAAMVTPEASTCLKYEINEHLNIEVMKSSKAQYKDNIKIGVKLETFDNP